MAGTVLVVDDSPTIRKVVAQVLQDRGYSTLAAGDGREALEVLSNNRVDMVLLDFVMPVMNGYQFCRELRADQKTEKMPVVLMSAKGDKIRGQFVEQTGAVDAITKPFDPRALLAVVESALRRPVTKPPKSEAPPDSTQTGLDLSALEAMEDPKLRAAEIGSLFSKGLARLLMPILTSASGRSDSDDLVAMLRERLQPQNLRGLGGLLTLLDQREEQSAALAGDLSFISIAEVLQMLELQRQTGGLKISYGDQEIVLYLSDGRIDLVKSAHLPLSFRLGRFLLEDGVVEAEALQALMEETVEKKRLLGEELLKQGLASADQVQVALKRQSSELVYEVVRWNTGRFTFDVNASCAEATLAHLQLAPGGLLMEGFRRVDEWQLIEGSFKFDDVLLKDDVAIERYTRRSKLTPQEEQVLDAVNGSHTVRQVVDLVAASTFDTCKVIYQFLKSRLVRVKSV